MRTTWFALSLCLSLASSLAARGALAADPTPASVWKNDFAAAEAEARSSNRPLVAHFHASWCGPCKKMEREVLHYGQALQLLGTGFVAVKVDFDKYQEVAQKYGVKNLPTDLIISPAGKVLVRSEGYEEIARAGDRDRKAYVANLSRINNEYAAKAKPPQRPAVVADNKNSAEPRATIKKDRTVASAAPATKDKLVPPASKVDTPSGLQTDEPSSEDELPIGPLANDEEDIQVAMDGYCPVTLRTTRAWKTGDKAISLEHQGQIYYFINAEKRDEFKAHPARYAPRLLGCDPVTLAENDVAIRGSTQFGAFYDGALFLFESAASRAKFRTAPIRYSKLKHVLKPEDIKSVASNVDR